MLWTSDAWWMSHLSHQPSDPAYYIEYCRILKYSPKFKTLLSDWSAIQNWNWFFTNKIHTTKELDFESWFLFSIYMLYGTYVLLLHISWSHSYSTVAVVLGGQGAVQWWHGSSYYFVPVCFTRESAAFCTLLELHQFYFMKKCVCLIFRFFGSLAYIHGGQHYYTLCLACVFHISVEHRVCFLLNRH